MKNKYELAGGIVTRENEHRWRVNAPDGRNVGIFKTRKAALEKAEHWDKWDALASLQDICMTMMPQTTTLLILTIGSIKDGELKFTPTDEQLSEAVTTDILINLVAHIIAQRVENERS